MDCEIGHIRADSVDKGSSFVSQVAKMGNKELGDVAVDYGNS